MKNNDINDEDYGKDNSKVREPTQEETWAVGAVMLVIAAGLASVIVCLFIRLDRWILH